MILFIKKFFAFLNGQPSWTWYATGSGKIVSNVSIQRIDFLILSGIFSKLVNTRFENGDVYL